MTTLNGVERYIIDFHDTLSHEFSTSSDDDEQSKMSSWFHLIVDVDDEMKNNANDKRILEPLNLNLPSMARDENRGVLAVGFRGRSVMTASASSHNDAQTHDEPFSATHAAVGRKVLVRPKYSTPVDQPQTNCDPSVLSANSEFRHEWQLILLPGPNRRVESMQKHLYWMFSMKAAEYWGTVLHLQERRIKQG